MTRTDAKAKAYRRAYDAGLDTDTAFAVVARVMEIFHEDLTEREWREFVEEEIQRHANP